MDYLRYWSLRRQPFLSDSDDLFFAGASHREAMAGLSYFVSSSYHVARLVAPPRCGMTRMLQHVQRMQGLGDTAVEAIVTDGQQLRDDRLSADLLNAMGIANSDGGSGLAQTLQSSADQGVRLLWLIDRCKPDAAASIESWSHSFPLLSVVIGVRRLASGQVKLVLNSDHLQVDLEPLSLEDTFEYLRYCLRQAGGQSTLISDAATVRLHETSGGAIADLAWAAESSLRLAARHGFNVVMPAAVEAVAEQRCAA